MLRSIWSLETNCWDIEMTLSSLLALKIGSFRASVRPLSHSNPYLESTRWAMTEGNDRIERQQWARERERERAGLRRGSHIWRFPRQTRLFGNGSEKMWRELQFKSFKPRKLRLFNLLFSTSFWAFFFNKVLEKQIKKNNLWGKKYPFLSQGSSSLVTVIFNPD